MPVDYVSQAVLDSQGAEFSMCFSCTDYSITAVKLVDQNCMTVD